MAAFSIAVFQFFFILLSHIAYFHCFEQKVLFWAFLFSSLFVLFSPSSPSNPQNLSCMIRFAFPPLNYCYVMWPRFLGSGFSTERIIFLLNHSQDLKHLHKGQMYLSAIFLTYFIYFILIFQQSFVDNGVYNLFILNFCDIGRFASS